MLVGGFQATAFQELQEIYINGEIHPQGMLSLSSDKKYLTLYGYQQYGNLGGNSSAVENPRKLLMVDALGTHKAVSLSNVHGNAAARGAFLQNIGANYMAYLAGSGTSVNNGLQNVEIDANLFEETGSNVRVWGMNSNTPRVFDGKLYLAGASNDTRVLEIGSINPTSGALTRNVKEVIATGTLTDPLDILVLNGDVLYVADKSFGIRKYYLNAGQWLPAGNISLPNNEYFVALTGRLNNGQREIYALSSPLLNNAIYKIEDGSLTNQTLSTNNYTIDTILSAGPDKGFRGISFTPEPFATLPLQLEGFSARLQTQGTVLNWNVPFAGELTYRLSRSTDAVDFKLLSSFNNSKDLLFSYLDPHPLSGVNYYKLQAYNQNGEEQFSKVLSVNRNLGEKATLPSAIIENSNVLLHLPTPNQVQSIKIHSVHGQQLYHKTKPIDQNVKIPILQKGLIVVSFQFIDGTHKVTKLIH